MGDFDGRIILVTGSATGLGAAIAVGAARRGAKAVILNYSKSRTEAEATADAVRSAGAEVEIAQGDVAEDADCRRIAEAAARFGRLDALVNNAGITKHVQNHANLDGLSQGGLPAPLRGQHRRPVPDAARLPLAAGSRRAPERADDLVHLGRDRHRLVGRLRRLQGRAQHHGAVAGAGAGAQDPRQRHLSGLHRHALVQQRVRRGEGCAACARTWRSSVPLQVASKPEDIADAALFFISDAARHVTGEMLLIDGGMHLGFAPTRAR